MSNVTDIWFVAEIEIEELAEKLGLSDIVVDAENYWEWATGELEGFKLDITRTHTVNPKETDTRIFLLGDNEQFSKELCDQLVRKLKTLNIAPIYLGIWIYKQGNEFEKIIEQTIT